MKLNISLQKIIYEVIYSNKFLKKTYDIEYPNKTYESHNIITNIIYILETGISFRKNNGNIHWKSLLYHFNRFIYYGIFKKVYHSLLNKYLKLIIQIKVY